MTDHGYKHAAEILKASIHQMLAEGVPKDDVPPLLADFATMFAYAAGKAVGTLAILSRMSQHADELEAQDDDDRPAAANADFLLRTFSEDDTAAPQHDFSLIRHAMEDMTQLQGIDLEQACACMVYYALGLLIQKQGVGKGEELVQFAQDELARLKAERGS